MKAAIVIPAFNEQRSIAAVVASVCHFGIPIVVDDGSSDNTGVNAEAAGAVVVRQDNCGYDAALATGFAKANELGVDAIVSSDADGQIDNAIIPRALECLERDQVAMVLGLRNTGAGRWSESLFNVYSQLRFGVPDILCGLKAFRIEAYRRHCAQPERPSVHTALALALLREGEAFSTVPVVVRVREGRSRFGGALKGNLKILRALGDALSDDLSRKKVS